MSQSGYFVITFGLPISLHDEGEDQGDLISYVLHEQGCLGVEETSTNTHTTYKAYFAEEGTLEEKIDALKNHPVMINLKNDIQKNINIEGTWIGAQSTIFKPVPFEPLEIINQLWIVPPPDMPTETKRGAGDEIILRPGMAFGTGRHESTTLASELLAEIATPQKSLMDVGTGSGILALVAAKKGYEMIETAEIDADARENAQENFELNGKNFPLYADLSESKKEFDVVVANILAPTLIYLKDQLLLHLKTGGALIMAGIVESEANVIEEGFASLKLDKKIKKNEWIAYRFIK